MGSDHYEYKIEYLNGKEHGKEYRNGKLIYEGDYLNGEKHGKGKEYCNGKLIYEGDYLNGKKYGKGKEYDDYDGKLKYEGEYLKGERHGKGKEYYDGKLKYEGEYLNGKKYGKGKEYYSNGKLKYEGEYLNGKNWSGYFYNINGSFEFKLTNGKGKGKNYDSSGHIMYEGEYENWEKHGKGKEYSNGKLKYEGEYINDIKHGKGKEYDSNGVLIYEGEYINGEKNGKDYFITLIKRFQRTFAQNFNKKGKKISFEFDIRDIKKNLNGAAFEIFFFDKTKCSEFMDIKLDHNNNALICSSIYFEVKDENIIISKSLENMFSIFFIFWECQYHFYNFPFKLQLNNNGKKVLISLVCNEEELIKVLLDLGKNIKEYIKFNLVLKSDINLSEIINNDIDILKIFTLIFSMKTEASNVNFFFENILKILKDVKIGKIKIYDKISKYLDFVISSLGLKLKIEYDAKILAEQFEKNSKKLIISEIEEFLRDFYYYLASFGLLNTLESINLDDINIILGDPRYLNYYVISIKIPGLSKFNEYYSSKH